MNEIDYAKVGQKLKQLRSDRGITQDKVAADLECTVSFISNVENHRAKLNLRVLVYYADLLSVSIDEILAAGRENLPSGSRDEILCNDLLRIFQTFSPEEQKKIVEMMKLWKTEPQQ